MSKVFGKKKFKGSKSVLSKVISPEIDTISQETKPNEFKASLESDKKEIVEDQIVLDSLEEDFENTENVTFESLGLIPQLSEACKVLGYKKPTKIQREAIPWALKGRDIIGLAQTGSGKTASFALPVLQALMANPSSLFCCVMSPTRELAIQIAKQFEALGAIIGVKCAVIVGGIDPMIQALALAKKPHILVGSPGRILYHLQNTKGFSLRTLKYLVLDEADRLLNRDFDVEIELILSQLPKERKTYLYSATMTRKVEKLQKASLINPVRVEVSTKYATVDKLIQSYLFIPAKYKDCYLVYLLNEFSGNSVIVFSSTRRDTQRITILLRTLGFPAVPLHGQLNQAKRLGSLNKFTTGERSVLIATDVASRGLDIPKVDIVINYDIPAHSKDYIHRVGRTARAERSGRAISLVSQYDVELYQRIEQLVGKKLDRYPCEEAQVLVFLERVTEAERVAAIELREAGITDKKPRSNTNEEENNDTEETIDELSSRKRRAKNDRNASKFTQK